MKRNSIPLCLAVGFFALAVAFMFFNVSKQALVSLSLSSFFYTLAQSFKNYVDLRNEELKSQVDTFNSIGGFHMTQSQLLLMKRNAPGLFRSKKEKQANTLSIIFECMAFAVLLVGLTIPFPLFQVEKIGDIATVLSFGFLFLSMWLAERYSERKSQWEDIQLISTLFQQQNLPKTEDTHHADT